MTRSSRPWPGGSPSPLDRLEAAAAARAAAGLVRTLRTRPPGGQPGWLDLASNDYLGLALDPAVTAAAAAGALEYGAGATGSRLVTGTTEPHRRLEAALASFVGFPAGLVFSSGYLANLGVVAGLGGKDVLVVSDAYNHASVVDGCRLARSPVAVTPHNDVRRVVAELAGRAVPHALVVTESVFSVDGDLAPLRELHAVAREHGALLLVDEAHAVGVVGPAGRGAVAAAGLAGEPDVVVTVTLSKALAAQGGAVLGDRRVVDHLVNVARSFVFDTGLSPAAAAGAHAALGQVVADPGRVARPVLLAQRLAARLRSHGLTVPESAGPVVSVVVGDPARAVAAAAFMRGRQVEVGCFRPPSVPDGLARLRMTTHAGLADTDVDDVADAVRDALA